MSLQETALLPALRLVASLGKVATPTAIRILCSKLSLSQVSRPQVHGPSGDPANAVTAALYSLQQAGLLDVDAQFRWVLTREGEAVLESSPQKLDFDDLNQIPVYLQHWRDVARDNLRNDFLALRFEHYTCGRLLLLQGSFNAAAVLLGYAIEFHLKAAMTEVEDAWTRQDRNLVERSHDLSALYRAALKLGILDNTFISLDFMDFARDHFTRRYPRQARKLLFRRGYWSFDRAKLHTYDDAIIQLDTELSSLYNSKSLTLGAHALGGFGVGGDLARAFFHNNVFALDQLSAYAAANEDERGLNVGREMLAQPEALFACDDFDHPGRTLERAKDLLTWNLAAFFRYPKKGEPDPDPSRLIFGDDAHALHGVNYSRWVIERARSEFGQGAIEVVLEGSGRDVTLRVFDRRAKKWYRSLALRRGHIDFFVRNSESEIFIDKWFAATNQQFTRRRANLRVPGGTKRFP